MACGSLLGVKPLALRAFPNQALKLLAWSACPNQGVKPLAWSVFSNGECDPKQANKAEGALHRPLRTRSGGVVNVEIRQISQEGVLIVDVDRTIASADKELILSQVRKASWTQSAGLIRQPSLLAIPGYLEGLMGRPRTTNGTEQLLLHVQSNFF